MSIDLEYISTLFAISGFIIGLGAVTVIDLHGFLARKSRYWTETTIRAHKVTKPLIWFGTILNLIGISIYYGIRNFPQIGVYQIFIIFILIINGLFLSFWVSPRLLKREKENRSSELLPNTWQRAITASFLVSFMGWWGNLIIFIYIILN